MNENVNGYNQPHKDSPKIDQTSRETVGRMKQFKGGKDISSQWLTKKHAVNQMIDSEYHPHMGQEEL